MTKRGAEAGMLDATTEDRGREDVDVSGVDAAAAPVLEEDDDEEEEGVEAAALESLARRLSAGSLGAGLDCCWEEVYWSQEDWISSRDRGLRLWSWASRASKQAMQWAGVAMVQTSFESTNDPDGSSRDRMIIFVRGGLSSTGCGFRRKVVLDGMDLRRCASRTPAIPGFRRGRGGAEGVEDEMKEMRLIEREGLKVGRE